MRPTARACFFLILALPLVAMVSFSARAAISLTPLVSFFGTNGASPQTGLVLGADGNFYGTTAAGGDLGFGIVFSMTPTGVQKVLYSFNGAADGATPSGTLYPGSDGKFYGTTAAGGQYGFGTVFAITGSGTLTTLFSFDGGQGASPMSGLVRGTNGNFYGTTSAGGASNAGAIFMLGPSGPVSVLYSFSGSSDGASPTGLLLASDNSFYGTTKGGGTFNSGTIFSLSSSNRFRSLYSFTGLDDGIGPQAGLLQGQDGAFYGTTAGGGTNRVGGTIFRMRTIGGPTATLNTIHSFGTNDGMQPSAQLIQGSDGRLYGTTFAGGLHDRGILFSVDTSGALVDLYDFNGGNDGSNPRAALLQGADGNFYGTASNGGRGRKGTVYRLSNFAPVIVLQPTNQSVLCGQTVRLLASAAGSARLIFRWQLNSNNLVNQGNISGANQPALVITNATARNAGTYRLVVTNSSGLVMSSNAVISVIDPPTLTVLNPAPNAILRTPSLVVNGRTRDNIAISDVHYRLNGAGWQLAAPAAGWTTWTANISLSPGVNTLESYAANIVGIASTTNSVSFSFIPRDAFTNVMGTYNGLFAEANGVALPSAGFLAFTLARNGQFTGYVQLGGARYPISGQLDIDGNATVRLLPARQAAVTVQLRINLELPNRTLTGTISNGAWTAALSAERAAFDGRTQVAPQAGQYTFAMAGAANPPSAPQGYSFGTIIVDKAGLVHFAATLVDGTQISQAVALSKTGRWPLYVPLYGAKGSIWAELKFPDAASDNLSGEIVWIKPSGNGGVYPAGFTNTAAAFGWHYNRPASGNKILALTDALLILEGGNLAHNLTNHISLGAQNQVTDLSNRKLHLSFTPTTGLFAGSLIDPASLKRVSFAGGVAQSQIQGYGFFLGTNQPGTVILLGPGP
jgi:uncharacterized repeat protein (TIGR03803 family)